MTNACNKQQIDTDGASLEHGVTHHLTMLAASAG